MSERPPRKKELVRAKPAADENQPITPEDFESLILPTTPAVPIHPYQRLAKYPDIIPGVLRIGRTNIFSGLSRGGKSTLLGQVVAHLHRGEPIFGVECRKPACIVYVALDHPWQDYQTTFDAVGISESDLVWHATCNDNDPEAENILHTIVERRGTYRAMEWLMERAFPKDKRPPEDSLIVIDPIHPLTGKDINDYSKVQRSLTGITRYCQHRQVVVLGVGHAAKLQTDTRKGYARKVDRTAGSTAMSGYSSTVMSLTIPEEMPDKNGNVGKIYLWDWNARGAGAPRSFQLIRDDETELGLFKLWNPAQTEAEEDAEAAERLKLAVGRTLGHMHHSEPMLTSAILELVEKDGTPRRTIERDLQVLYTGGMITKVKKGLWLKLRPLVGN